jgi:hypothetical protein
MNNRSDLGNKYLGETCKAIFDFISRLAVGETISTATVTAVVYSGVDSTPSALISGSAAISGTQVTQLTVGGVLGVVYLLTCSVTTSGSQTLVLEGFMGVVP